MAVVPKRARAQSALLAQIAEKAGRRIGKRDSCGRSANVADEPRDNQAQELFNRAANLFREPRTGLTVAPAGAVCADPIGNENPPRTPAVPPRLSLPARGRTRQTGPGVELCKVSSALHSPARQDARHSVRSIRRSKPRGSDRRCGEKQSSAPT